MFNKVGVGSLLGYNLISFVNEYLCQRERKNTILRGYKTVEVIENELKMLIIRLFLRCNSGEKTTQNVPCFCNIYYKFASKRHLFKGKK